MTTELLSPNEAKQRGQNALWLDVRTPAEFEEAHIDGAVLHPLARMPWNNRHF